MEVITDELKMEELNGNEFQAIERIGDAALRLLLCQIFYIENRGYMHTHYTVTRMQTNAHMGKVAEIMGIRPHPKATNNTRYADALEYKIGRLYLDGGLESARAFVEEYIKVFKQELP